MNDTIIKKVSGNSERIGNLIKTTEKLRNKVRKMGSELEGLRNENRRLKEEINGIKEVMGLCII